MLSFTKEHPISSYTDQNGCLHISDEDASVALIKSIDLFSQRVAINKLVSLINRTQINEQEEIKKIEVMCKNASGSRNDFLVDELVDSYHFSVYFDSTYSMAILGMIAPTVESLFYEIFLNIGKLGSDRFPKRQNCRINHIEQELIWDCHYYINKGNKTDNIIAGIQQLAKITGFREYLPNDYYNVIDALFLYRNMMFHNGLEWNEEYLDKFMNKINSNNVMKNWFTCSTRDSKPWIYYMTNEYMERCFRFINEIEIASGAFYIENYC